jgi:hypothetical protein
VLGCGGEWIAIKDCQLDLDCVDLFGDCDAVADAHRECDRLARNREYCEANCPDFDIAQCEQDTTECRESVDLDGGVSDGGSDGGVSDGGSDGGCSQPSFPEDQPDISPFTPPVFVTETGEEQLAVRAGDELLAEITVNGTTRQILVELSSAWTPEQVILSQDPDTSGNETVPVTFLTNQDTRGRFYMRLTLCGFDCDERVVIFDINPNVNSDYERTLIENGEVVRIDRTCVKPNSVLIQ